MHVGFIFHTRRVSRENVGSVFGVLLIPGTYVS